MVTRKLPYYEFADGIYEIDEFDCVSVFVIVGSKRALVIDCGTGIGTGPTYPCPTVKNAFGIPVIG